MLRPGVLLLLALAGCPATSVGVPGVGGAGGVDVQSGALPSCANGKKDDNETDVDCGPACGVPCGDGAPCGAGKDCVSGVCRGGTCAAAACDDRVKNGTESDVDCGGLRCAPCANGRACRS